MKLKSIIQHKNVISQIKITEKDTFWKICVFSVFYVCLCEAYYLVDRKPNNPVSANKP